MAPQNTVLKISETQARTRLLLALWDLGGIQQEVKKGELTKRLVSKGKKVADYHNVFEELENEQAISKSKKGYSLELPKGLEVLDKNLKSTEFEFEGTIVGTWAANALLKWIHEMNCGLTNTSNNYSATVSENIVSKTDSKSNIASYDEFKQVALQVYEQLNSDYNLDNLVPIYRIRRKIGDIVSRKQFSDWLLEMQAEDIFQLEGGSVEDSAPDKIEDSITTELDGLRCYASKL
ncbi:hypothetical protein NIES267_44440 [Calothrix parasitica NIES-267]|uniref:Uncharacterized protein n=1 Tax=Calothrix parasitica NIES-267 TaxID=1973488 RepID=A0A1Z4LUL6_9CYAN|nr:hypothetical protein NIES267_44440 [Calothrix parasitica NIES-267]